MKTEGLWTPSSQLYFTPQQLQQLNVYFSDMEIGQDLKQNQTVSWIEGEIEKLIQYLSYVVGNLDSRFASEFVVRLESMKSYVEGNNCFSYLIRLDSLSIPTSPATCEKDSVKFHIEFQSDKIPDGFAKIKLEDEISTKKWREFTTNAGYLKRDKIQKRYIELLEEATTPKLETEKFTSTSYDSPGKILDAEILYHVLNIPPEERIFYGSSKEGKKFDSSDVRKFRIEVIESNYLIRLRIGFLSPNVILDEDIDVILVLGIGLQGWPATSDYPRRIPLINGDALLHHQAATTGFFLMTAYPQTLANDKSRTVLWQFFFPSVDCMLTNHYSQISCVIRTINIVYIVILNLRRTTPGGHTIGKFIIKTLTWFQLENLNEPKKWTSNHLSYHVISILDELVSCLRQRKCRSYFFEKYNALTSSFRNTFNNPTANDYKEDADIIETFIHRIYALSSSELIGHGMITGERRQNNYVLYESVVMQKWNNLLNNMATSRKHDSHRIAFISKQTEYITFLFRALLITESVIIPADNQSVNSNYSTVDYTRCMLKRQAEHDCMISLEDACYIICLLLDQAKHHFLIHRKRDKIANGPTSRPHASNLDQKTEEQYKQVVKSTLTKVRENPLRLFRSDLQAVTFILQTVCESTTASKMMRKILKPYLKLFSITTLENCWYLEEWRNRVCNEELIALRIFSKLVAAKMVNSKDGLLDAVGKSWDWARDMVNLCIRLKSGCELLFTSSSDQVYRQYLIFSDEEIKQFTKQQSNTSKCGYKNTINELCEILKLEEKLEYFEEDTSVHFRLRDGSPMTRVISGNRRRGTNLGLGHTVFSLAALGKFTTLQEITEILPEEKRHRALEFIQRVIREKQRSDRERGKLKDRNEIFRLLPERVDSQCQQTSGNSKPKDTIYGNIISLDDSQSPNTTYSTCSSSAKAKYIKGSARISCNPVAYYDAPVMYFQPNSSSNWQNPTSQPYLQLSPDKQLSLSAENSGSFVSHADSETFSIRM